MSDSLGMNPTLLIDATRNLTMNYLESAPMTPEQFLLMIILWAGWIALAVVALNALIHLCSWTYRQVCARIDAFLTARGY